MQISYTPDPVLGLGLTPCLHGTCSLVGKSGIYSPLQKSLCQAGNGSGAMERSSGEPSIRPGKTGFFLGDSWKTLRGNIYTEAYWHLEEGEEMLSPKPAGEPSARGEREWHGVFQEREGS